MSSDDGSASSEAAKQALAAAKAKINAGEGPKPDVTGTDGGTTTGGGGFGAA